MKEWIRQCLRDFSPPAPPQRPGTLLPLHDNSNLIGQNPVVEKVLEEIKDLNLNFYPSPFSEDLREAIAKKYNCRPQQVLVGSGASEILDIVSRTFLDYNDVVAIPSPSFVLHSFFPVINLAQVKKIPLTETFMLKVEEFINPAFKLILFASPNNPTGNAFYEDDIVKILKEFDGPVVIDESYAEFSYQDFVSRVNEFKNLIVIRTFSKAYGLAGIRVGYAIGNEELISQMYKVKTPFTVNPISERIALEALKDEEFLQRCVEIIREERHKLYIDLLCNGYTPYHTVANFMLIKTHLSGDECTRRLKEKGILVWSGSEFEEIKDCIRVTIGTPQHTERFLQAIKEIKSET